jgi:hypothetical protein
MNLMNAIFDEYDNVITLMMTMVVVMVAMMLKKSNLFFIRVIAGINAAAR